MHVIYYVAVSLDGFVAPLDGSIDWLAPYGAGDEDYGFAAFFRTVDALVEGRRTYEQALSFGEWPHRGKPCWVVTGSTLTAQHSEVRFSSAAPVELLRYIASQGHSRVWLVGGSQLAGSFRAAGLIDEYVLSLVPVLLGTGKPLFAHSAALENLRLVESRQYPDGLVQLRYTRASGPPEASAVSPA